MKLGDWLTFFAYVVALVFYFNPEVSASISSLNVTVRVLITLLFLVLPILPSLYYRYLKPKEVSENFPFNPFEYYPGETMRSFGEAVLPCVELYSSAEGLREDKVDCKFADPREFKLPEAFEDKAYHEYWSKLAERLGTKEKELGTSAKARLFDLQEDKKNGRLVLYLQRTDYWRTLVTNFFLDWMGYGENLREEIVPKPRLKPLHESILSSNHLGMNCILLTGDGKIVLQDRSKKVVINPESIGLASEGAMGWEDRTAKEFAPSPFVGMSNQLHDELGITREEIDEIRLNAIYRNLYWGGKPAAFFIARTNLSFVEVVRHFRDKPESAWETKLLIPFNKDDVSAIKKYLKRKDVSFPAKVGLYYYLEFSGIGK